MAFLFTKKFLIVGIALASALAIACGSQASSTTLNSPLTSPAGSNFVADTGPGPSPIIERDKIGRAHV